jgi:hypothetical protein
MATINKVDIKDALVLETNNPSFSTSKMELPGMPLAAPANVEVTTAAKLELAAGTRCVAVGCLSGAIYAISGMADTADIAVGQGWWCPEGQKTFVPVGFHTDGTLHTRLLVIAAA